MPNGSIAIFDSGIGGITVYRQLRQKLPTAKFIYFADTAHLPYGNRPVQEVLSFTLDWIDRMLTRRVAALVIACNTMSTALRRYDSAALSIPLFTVGEAGAELASQISKTGQIGVLATNTTCANHMYADLIRSHRPDAKVTEVPSPHLANLIEGQHTKGPAGKAYIELLLSILAPSQVDTVILGCTHYPLISDNVLDFFGKHVQVIDPAIPLSERVEHWWHSQPNRQAHQPDEDEFLVTDRVKLFKKNLDYFLGKNAKRKVELVEPLAGLS